MLYYNHPKRKKVTLCSVLMKCFPSLKSVATRSTSITAARNATYSWAVAWCIHLRVSMPSTTGCATASCCKLTAGAAASWQASWFAAANFFCENFTKMFYNFCLIGKLIFYGKYGIIYIERKLRRDFICYTDKEVRIFLKKLFKNPLTFPPFYAII